MKLHYLVLFTICLSIFLKLTIILCIQSIMEGIRPAQEDERENVVEDILAHSMDDGRRFYYVKWLGFER